MMAINDRNMQLHLNKRIQLLPKFYHQLMHKGIALKGVLKFTLKQLQHVLV